MSSQPSKSCVVLLSAGLDSSVNFWEALHQKFDIKLAITFDYGQRAKDAEIRQAKKICDHAGVKHLTLSVPFIQEFGMSSLTQSGKEIPTGKSVEIDSMKTSTETAKSVWVPNRNGILLNIAAGFAESLKASFVIPGFNKEEAATFPDNTQEFLSVLDQSFSYSTSNKVKTLCFTTQMDKTQIVARGLELKAEFAMIWPCYFSGEKWCGQCESCQRSLRGFKNAGIDTSAWTA